MAKLHTVSFRPSCKNRRLAAPLSSPPHANDHHLAIAAVIPATSVFHFWPERNKNVLRYSCSSGLGLPESLGNWRQNSEGMVRRFAIRECLLVSGNLLARAGSEVSRVAAKTKGANREALAEQVCLRLPNRSSQLTSLLTNHTVPSGSFPAIP